MNTYLTHSPSPIGDYVTYKGTNQVIVDCNDCCTQFKILDPTTNVKLVVSTSNENLHATMHPFMVTVNHEGKNYLVSKRGLIISLTTGRVMKWDDNNGNRKAILGAI